MNRRKLIQCLAVASLLLGTASCINDDYGVDGCNQGPANVRLMVQTDATRSIGSGDTDNEVRQLRVYAFNAAGERVGYAYVEDVPQGAFYVKRFRRFGRSDSTAVEQALLYRLAGSRRGVHLAHG